ncbi:hypothetical protein D043_3432B, partial [Vibrio parahaemolyticus EKP-021]
REITIAIFAFGAGKPPSITFISFPLTLFISEICSSSENRRILAQICEQYLMEIGCVSRVPSPHQNRCAWD